jgi:hypothetical protein
VIHLDTLPADASFARNQAPSAVAQTPVSQ